jgi:hypothetical protein
MLTAEKLFSDIEKFSSDISGVRVATELGAISHPLRKRSGNIYFIERPTSPEGTNGPLSIYEKALNSSMTDFELNKPTASVIGSIAKRSSGLIPGRLEKRVSKFVHQSAFWLRRSFKRSQRRKNVTTGNGFTSDDSREVSSSMNTTRVEPHTGEIDTVADRTSSATSETK